MNDIFKNLLIFNFTQKKRIQKNALSGFSAESLQILSQIFFAPLMLFFWGPKDYGIWLFIISIPNIFFIFNINFQNAATQEIIISNEKKNYYKSNKIFQNSIFLNLINILAISLVVIILYNLNLFNLSIFDSFTYYQAKIILILICGAVYLELLNSTFNIVIQSTGKIYITFYTSTILDLVAKLLIALSGFYFDSLLYPAIIYFIFSTLKFSLLFLFFIKLKKHLSFSLHLISKIEILKIFKLSVGHSADILNFLIKHSLTIFIMGLFLDPFLIGYVVTIKTIFYFLPTRFCGKIFQISLFEFASLFSKNKISLIKKNIFKFNRLIFFLLIIFITLSLTIGPYFYNTWTNFKYDLKIVFLSIIVFDAFFSIMRRSMIIFFISINRYLFLGSSDLIITCISCFGFYLMLLNNFSINFSFLIFTIGSLISLIFSLIYFFYCFKNLKVNK